MSRYSYSENSRPIDDIEGYCEQYSDHFPYWSYWHNYGNLPLSIRRYEAAINGKKSSDYEYQHKWEKSSDYEHCINNTRKYVAIVHFHIAPSANDLINKIVKSPRVTTADILSNIGT